MRSQMLHRIAFFAVFTVFAPGLSAQGVLTWKLNSGEQLNYVITQETDMQLEVAGQRQSMKLIQVMDLAWKITDVTATEAKMDQVITRIRLSSSGGAIEAFAFDTENAAQDDSPVARSIAGVFGKVTNESFQVTMKNNGQIAAVEVPESILKTLPATGVVTEQTLRQMMTQSAVTFPSTAVVENDSWQSNQTVDVQFGTMKIGSELTYRKRDAASGHAVITIVPKISIVADESSPQQVAMKSSEGSGTIHFDTERGRVVTSELDLTMQMQVSQFGRNIDQVVRQRTKMELAE
jgi:hypothetical protein